jgi:DNA polymerase-3 subunit delta
MTPAQFLTRIKKGLPPAALLLGPESYGRRHIKDALCGAFPENAVTRHDLGEVGLAEILDDARSLSLFAAERLIWVANAEAALPRGRSEEDEGAGAGGDASLDGRQHDLLGRPAHVRPCSTIELAGGTLVNAL